jgi:transcriptional regulator with XRE-family HTH domain
MTNLVQAWNRVNENRPCMDGDANPAPVQTFPVAAKKELAKKVQTTLERRLAELEWDAKELQKRSKLPRTTIHRIMTAANDPTVSVLVAISKAVRMTLDELVGNSVPETPGISERQAEILTAYRHRDDVKSIMDTLVPRGEER